MNSKNISFVVLLLLTVFGYSQKNNFNKYNVRNGLPQNTVYKIFQDSRGYIWFGTDGGGVSKFDGKKHYYYNKSNGLSGNVVRDIIEDNAGNIWFATDEGVSKFNGLTFENFNTSNGLSNNITVVLLEDSKNNIWVGTAGGGLNIIQPNKKNTINYYTDENGLASNNVFSIIEDNYNRIWLGYIGGNPQIVKFRNNQLVVDEINTSFNHDLSTVYCGKKDKNGNIWYGTIKNGVFKYENISLKSNPNMVSYSILNGLKDNYILSITEQNENIWLGTNDGGVNYIKNGVINYLDKSDGLPNNQILTMLNDKENNLWISCMGEGVLKLNGFEFSHFSKADGLISNQISCIKKSKNDSTIWISTFDAGLQEIYIQNNKVVAKTEILSENLLYNSARTFDIDKKNNLWIGTQNGIVVWNKKIIAAYDDKDIAGNQINTILCAKNGMVWIGTSSGLSFFNNNDFGVFTEDEGLINNEVQTIIEDKEGAIWIGTLGGLAMYKDNSITTFDKEEGLSNLKIHSLIQDRFGNILIGTYGSGIFLLDKKSPKKIKQFLINEKLTSNNIYSLSFDNENILIVGTDKGFDKIYYNSKYEIQYINHYTDNNGFLPIENNQNAIWNDSSKNITFFGTVNGLTIYQPSLELKEKPNPSLILENIKLFNQEIDWSKLGKINKYHLPLDLKLPYNKNFITFQYSTINFSNPNNVKYIYQLKGFNDEWYTSYNNEIVFQGLEPKTYTLVVKSITENGLSSAPHEYTFIILPPFYKTWWFFLISVSLLVSVVIAYNRFRLNRLRKEKIMLEKTVSDRTKEVVKQKDIIEEKNKEITDSITYAQRIQNAILPDDEKLTKLLHEYFILFNPKDIVSGDFYWASSKKNKIYIMAADCTGHGVPGAIMSVIGHTSLEATIKTEDDLSAGAFLDKLSENLIHTLMQSNNQIIKDGMDLGLCIIDLIEYTIEYAGANNPLYFVRKKDNNIIEEIVAENNSLENDDYFLVEIKANKQPIGYFENRTNFTTHKINIKKGDSFYLFSDGYADQFGGDKGKKFKYKPFKQLLLDIQPFSMQQQKIKLNNEINNWMQPNDNIHYEQIDDILIVGFKV